MQCGLVILKDLKYCNSVSYLLDISCPHVALLLSKSSSVLLEYVRVMISYGYGLLEWDVVGTSLINCQVYCSNWRSLKEKHHERVSTHQSGSCPSSCEHNEPGGNVLFVHEKGVFLLNIYLYIFHSEFALGVARKANSSKIIGGGGLGIHTFVTAHKNISIKIYNSSLHSNIAPFGANMFLYYDLTERTYAALRSMFMVHISNCKFYSGNSTSSGGGLALFLREKVYMHPYNMYHNTSVFQHQSLKFIIEQCTFNSNVAVYGSGTYINVHHECPIETISSQIIISETTFFGNIARVDGAAIFLTLDYLTSSSFSAKISESKFILNRAITADGSVVGITAHLRVPITFVSTTFLKNTGVHLVASKFKCVVIHLNQAMDVKLVNSTFTENNCTCISTRESVIHLEGTLGFYRNTGYDFSCR